MGKECAMCQKRKAMIVQQIMVPLSLNRLTTSLRAFTRVAVDFGGWFMTVQGMVNSRPLMYQSADIKDNVYILDL